jgi:beta-exotoxin I transport system ATP-binding protein
MAALIETHSLTRRYGTRRGIEGVSLSVPEGSLYGFLGPNGAGKTTTIRVLLGFLRPTSGAARVFGQDCWKHSPKIKAEVGYIPGDLRLYSWMNGHSALAIVGAVRGRDLTDPGRELARELDLDLSVRVRAMSRGMRQKLGIILALAHKPRLLVLDEPTSGLDPLVQEQFRSHLRALTRAGHTVFFSSHTLSEVELLCDRVAIVKDGRIVVDEPLESLRRRAGHEVMIRWKSGQAMAGVEPPPMLRLSRREPAIWEGMLAGDIDGFIRWLARYDVEELDITRPDLERLFRRFYEHERGAPGASA